MEKWIMAHGFSVVWALLGIGIFGLMWLVWRSWKASEPLRRARRFLRESQALEAQEARDRKPGISGYDWAQFQKDLHDRGMSFEEIWERSGGRMPKRPEETKATPPTMQGYQGATEGFQGPHGREAHRGADGPDGRSKREEELQQWFKARAETERPLKIVAPPVPQLVVTLKGQMVRCPHCSMHDLGMPTQRLGGSYSSPGRTGGKCSSCGGKGYVIVTSG